MPIITQKITLKTKPPLEPMLYCLDYYLHNGAEFFLPNFFISLLHALITDSEKLTLLGKSSKRLYLKRNCH